MIETLKLKIPAGKSFIRSVGIAVSILGCICLDQAAKGQGIDSLQGKRTASMLPNVRRAVMKDDPATHYNLLKSPVELPGVPAYTGRATFVSGWYYPDAPDAKRTGLVYLVHEEPDEVLEWYKNSLSSYQWKVDKSSATTHQLTAVKGNLGCNIEVAPYNGPAFRTELRVGYREAR